MIREIREMATGYLALCVGPTVRGRGVGQSMVEALVHHPELATVQRLAAGGRP